MGKANKKKTISLLTIILIILSLISLFFTFSSYSYYKNEAKLYFDMIYAEPTEDLISSEDMSRLYEEELDKYILIRGLETNTQILDGDRQNMYLSYSHSARSEYFLNRIASIIFIVLSILSWKIDKLGKIK